MNWRSKIAKRVLKQIKRVPKKDVKRLLFVIDELSENPYYGDIEKVEGEKDVWRRRVGNYRILYEVYPKEKFISVFNVERKTTTTSYHR